MARKLLPYLTPHRWRIAWALLQVFLITGFELLKPWPLQVVIDSVLGGKPSPIAALSSPESLLLLACGGIVFVPFGPVALTLPLDYLAVRVWHGLVSVLGEPLLGDLSGV